MKNPLRLFCILSLLFSASFSAVAKDEPIKTSVVQAQLFELYEHASASYVGCSNSEYSFTVKPDGTTSGIQSSNDYNRNVVAVPVGDLALIHTHPSMDLPAPSKGDVAVAVRLGVPNYVLSKFALYVAEPDGTIRKVADVKIEHGQLELGYTRKTYSR
ncbi:MAG: hypothetical protein ABSF53_22470 [Terracidiphilus sp.]